MNVEKTILYSIWSITLISLVFLPKNRLREASISYLFQQSISWFLGLLVIEWHLIEYPVRELASVNKTSFTFEFFVYPVISAFFAIYYPGHRSLWIRFFYLSFFSTIVTVSEVLFENYTDLIKYVRWEWYYSWISVFLTLGLLRLFYSWFFKYDQRLSFPGSPKSPQE